MHVIIQLSFANSDEIIEQLNQGKRLSDIFLENNGDAFFSLLATLSNYMSLQEAMACALEVDQSLHKRSQSFLKNIAYPLFLFIFSYALILFFSTSIVPSMSVYAQDSSLGIINVLRAIYTLLFIGIGIVFLSFLLRNRVPVLARFYSQIHFFQKLETIPFSSVFKSLLVNGLSTTEALSVMQKIQATAKTAEKIYAALSQGKSFMEAMKWVFADLDLFVLFVETGVLTSNLSKLFEIYVMKTQIELNAQIKKWTTGIQIFSYLCVAIVVFVFYQVMLLPLNMLNTF